MLRHHLGRRGLTAALIAVLALAIGAVFGGASTSPAATSTRPSNTVPPTISGTPVEGSTLTADHGTWTGTTPITYSYQWERCGKGGGSCSDIIGQTNSQYKLRSADVGNTVRVRVKATNSDGSGLATSNPTAVV